jgi:hypothetical protein
MTELSFLIELLMNHKLPKVTKDLIAQRIREVEERFTVQNIIQPNRAPQIISPIVHGAQQSPSTLALMAKHGDVPPMPIVQAAAPEPVAVIAQTPQAAAAMQHRQEALAGKLDERGMKRKW